MSKNVETPITATVFATGNNLTIAGDLTRRALLGALDARCEHPERRSFEFDPIVVARTERGRLVVAALTVLRAWHVAGERIEPPPLGSFEEWSHRIRASLLWPGRPLQHHDQGAGRRPAQGPARHRDRTVVPALDARAGIHGPAADQPRDQRQRFPRRAP